MEEEEEEEVARWRELVVYARRTVRHGANGDNGEWQRMMTITAWSGRGGNDYAIDIWEAGKNNFEPKATGVNLLRLF